MQLKFGRVANAVSLFLKATTKERDQQFKRLDQKATITTTTERTQAIVPFNKKSISDDSTVSSEQEKQKQQRQVRINQSKSNSSFYWIDESFSDIQECNRSEVGFSTFSNERQPTFVERYLFKSVATLRRWLNLSIQTLLTILQPFLSKIFFAISSFASSLLFVIQLPESEETRVDRQDYQLTWEPTPAIPFSTETEYLHALILNKRKQNEQSHEHSKVDKHSLTAHLVSSLEHFTPGQNIVEASAIVDCRDYFTGMDLCQRKFSRRAAQNNTIYGGDISADDSLPSYWHQFLPKALAHLTTGASSGKIEDGFEPLDAENSALTLSNTASSKQRPRIDSMDSQGHPQPRRRRSCGLQIESSATTSSGGMRESGEYLLEHEQQQQHQLQGICQLHKQTPAGSSKHHLVSTAPDLMSALNNLQQQRQQQQQQQHNRRLPEQEQQQKESNNNNSAMNFNAHRHSDHHQQPQQNQQQCPRLNRSDGVGGGKSSEAGGNSETSMVLVSKSALNNLTDQIAFSMNKMKHLEEKVSVIPELQRRLDSVLVAQTDEGSEQAIQLQTQKHQPMQSDHSTRYNSLHATPNLFNNSHHHSLSIGSNQGSLVNNGPLRRRSNTNIGGEELSPISARAFHPSLQRRYNSFRQYSANKSSDANLSPQRDLISCRRSPTTTNRLSTRSPTATSRISRDYSGTPQHAQVFEHLNDRFGSGTTISSSSLSPLHLNSSLKQQSTACKQSNNGGDHILHSSFIGGADLGDISYSHKTEYQELINDLISLSYSVNYQSSSNSNNSVQSNSSSREKKSIGLSKTADSSPLHQVSVGQRSHSPALHHETTSSPATASFNGTKRICNTNSMGATKLDCGCQSFKEHLRYNNSINREQRLSNQGNIYHARSRSSSTTTINPPATVNTISTQNISQKVDASTNTELSMDDIVTKVELDTMVTSMQKAYSTLSSIASRDNETSQFKSIVLRHNHNSSSATAKHLSSTSPTSSGGSFTDPKSSETPPNSSSSRSSENSCGEDEPARSECSSNKGIIDEDEIRKSSLSDGDEQDDSDLDDEDKGDEVDGARSPSCGEPYSLGSSYQDPSDFEEYCAYGESLDRRTKDFMSQTTKIPNDLRFALIRLNDYIKKKHSFEQIESSSGCVEVIRKEWFKVAANKDSQATKTKLYVEYFESFTKQLLNSVVNLSDSAGNTAMHYAASHNKLDVIKVLLDTKVSDINRRNKAGYTPIMLLALADIVEPDEQEIARHLFSLGDVNIKARTSGQTAIMLAASHGRIATVRLLLECGADPSMQDYDGSTALMCGSEMGHEEVVRLLLTHKLTDPNETDNDGLDALTIAMNNGHKNIGLMLYAAKNVPRMVRSTMNTISHSNSNNNNSSNQTFVYQSSIPGYLGASLRRSRGKLATNYVKRADSLLSSRSAGVRPLIRQFVDS